MHEVRFTDHIDFPRGIPARQRTQQLGKSSHELQKMNTAKFHCRFHSPATNHQIRPAPDFEAAMKEAAN
jgi:hypothetical protein